MSIKISQLQPATSVTGSDLIVTVVTGAGTSLITEKATVQQVFNYITSSITDLTLNNLTVLDNTTLGSSSIDSLVVNATSQFNADLTASALNVVGNTALSTVSGTVAQFTELTASAIIASQISSSDAQFNSLSGSSVTGSDARFTTVTASFSGDGLNLSNIPNGALQNSSITIGSTSISLGDTQTVIDGITELTASSAYFSGDVFINGTASIVQLNTLGQQSLVVGDKYITILSGAADHVSLDGSGILWGSGSTDPTTDDLGAAAHVRYVGSFDKIRIFPGLYVSGALTASSLISGTQGYFNNIDSFSVSGTQAQFSYITGTLVGSISGATAQFTSITGTFVGAVSGNADTVTNGVYTVGNQIIDGIKTFTNTISASGGITGSNATFLSITGNLSGSITGNAATVTNGVYTTGNQIINGIKTFSGTVTASSGITGSVAKFTAVTSSFSGDGNNITNLTASHITNFTNDVRSQFSAGANIIIANGVISSTGGGGGGSGSISNAVATVTSSVILDLGYHTVYADASGGDITITLPTASIYNNIEYRIKKIDTSTTTKVTVSSSVGDLIDGYTHIPLDYRFEGITVQSDGTSSWFINSDVSAEITLVAQGYTSPVGSSNLYVLTGTAAGGADKTVQFNDTGMLTGSNQLTYDYNTAILSGTVARFTELTASFLSAPTLTGTVAYFTEITASSINAKLNNLTTNVLLIGADTLLTSEHHIILASASDIADLNITLPSSSASQYRQYVIKKVDSNASRIIISGSGGETIDGIDGTAINTQYETLTLVSDGISEWFII